MLPAVVLYEVNGTGEVVLYQSSDDGGRCSGLPSCACNETQLVGLTQSDGEDGGVLLLGGYCHGDAQPVFRPGRAEHRTTALMAAGLPVQGTPNEQPHSDDYGETLYPCGRTKTHRCVLGVMLRWVAGHVVRARCAGI